MDVPFEAKEISNKEQLDESTIQNSSSDGFKKNSHIFSKTTSSSATVETKENKGI